MLKWAHVTVTEHMPAALRYSARYLLESVVRRPHSSPPEKRQNTGSAQHWFFLWSNKDPLLQDEKARNMAPTEPVRRPHGGENGQEWTVPRWASRESAVDTAATGRKLPGEAGAEWLRLDPRAQGPELEAGSSAEAESLTV
ncbi:hypothetical protein mRhiFer1_009014 [Rhinolophus ferrumequinum]|uniref:Uncharacterized protein n=1 Tax=Rhinolophus ferrumequinum TaxID=59479 RepID=A0A7J7SXA8_RHIFE|nr:hypothetical protein mRhiFer1_009014 [Rhinolophus ferrumequinum]